MAKISAHGRHEVARFKRAAASGGEKELVVCSDNTILFKLSWYSEFAGKRRKESTGWKRYGKLKPGHLDAWAEKIAMRGYYRVK